MNDDVWLVIPLYNEETVIEDVVRQARMTFPNVCCVDDGSSDGSVAAAQRGGAVVVSHPVNLGQGAALQTGFEYVRSDPQMAYAVTYDADGQHQVADVSAMVARAREADLDMVLGSRFLEGQIEAGALKRLILRMATAFTNFMTGTKLTDAHNGLRVLSRPVVERLDIRQNRMAHASEIVALFGSMTIDGRPLRYEEMPVHILYTEYSKAKGQSVWNSVNILAELLWR